MKFLNFLFRWGAELVAPPVTYGLIGTITDAREIGTITDARELGALTAAARELGAIS
jgi:hypothetical protein